MMNAQEGKHRESGLGLAPSGVHDVCRYGAIGDGAAICTAAAFGVVVALLERRNGRVLLDDSRITIRSWRGRERTVEWDEVEAIDLTVPEGDEPELPFHWLTARTPDGGRIRLAGGPWPESVELRRLRREIVTRLGSSGGSAREFRPGRLLSATRQCWS